jgi:ribonuclease HI
MHFRYVRQLFQAVISAGTDYGAIIWHRPKEDGSAASTAQIKNLTTIQRLAMIATTGCYRTTSTAALEVESDLQPAWIRLQTKVLLATTRMQSLSPLHPIHEWISNALRTRTSSLRHRSNLEHIFQHFPKLTAEIETIEPFIRPPWWTARIQFQIAESKEAAKQQHDRITSNPADTVSIYTDGSGIDGKIGAAACNGQCREDKNRQYLGNENQFNVYAAELTAMNLAVEIAQESNEHTVWHIFADSQAAIQGVHKPRKQSGQAIIKEFLDATDQAMDENPRLQIKVTWIPGHAEIEGNERADQEAKQAAKSPAMGRHFKHKPLKSARIRLIKAEAKQQWRYAWNNNTHTGHALRRNMKARGFKTGSKFYNQISSRKAAATLARLRTGHCGLNQYLHRCKRADSPYCDCGDGKETVEHYLLECVLHKEARNSLRRKVGMGKMKVPSLLGQPKLIKHTMEFITSTKGTQI